ncbi:unnamed protein product [Lymnaea stagnalis]|uniref:Uncharacterized protein n=1 Tax=Lymnaea stagnalis TaxID=6523 RepID=A0AAV2IP07_LYMST
MTECSLRATVVVILALGLVTPNKADFLANSCLVKFVECLEYFEKIACDDDHAMLTECVVTSCSEVEIALLINVMCERLTFLSKIESANVSDQCRSSYDMCEPFAYPPPGLLLFEEKAHETFCYSMSSYSVRHCLVTSPGCSLSEVKNIVASACDFWPPAQDPEYLGKPCQKRLLTSFTVDSLPKCDPDEPAFRNSMSGCDEEPDQGYYSAGRACATFAVLEDVLEKVESPYLENCHAVFEECVKTKLFRDSWLEPVLLYMRICSNDEGLSTCNNTACNAEQMVSYISHVCAPKENLFISYECIQHAENYCLDEKSRLNCQLIDTAASCLLEQCNEFEAIILRREACLTLAVQGAFALEVANKTPACLKKISKCMQVFPFDDFFRFNSTSYAKKLCVNVNSPGMRTCLMSRPGCSYDEAISLVVAACQPVPSSISVPCMEKAVTCLGEAQDCEFLHNNQECIRTGCSSIEARFVITEMCPHIQVKQRLFEEIKKESKTCENSLETCAQGMFYERYSWKDHAEGSKFYCFFMQSKIFQLCMLKSCSFDTLSRLIDIACLPAFRLVTDVSAPCQAKGGVCFEQIKASTCSDIQATEECLGEVCNPEENARLRDYTCRRLCEMGSIIALALPSRTSPHCNDQLITCYSHIESWINLKRPRETLCNFTGSAIVKSCASVNTFCQSTLHTMNELACQPLGSVKVTVSKGCRSGIEDCFKNLGSNPSCDTIHHTEECLGNYCNKSENRRLRLERCEVSNYVDRVKLSVRTTSDKCLNISNGCIPDLNVPISTKFSYSERFVSTCRTLLDEKTSKCTNDVANTNKGKCEDDEYRRIIVAGCSKDSDRRTGFSEACINGYLNCFSQLTSYRCSTVQKMASCFQQECSVEEEKTITGGLCETVEYVSSVLRKATGMHGKCAKSLSSCHNVTFIEKTLWIDRLGFAKKACEIGSSRDFKLCVGKDCNLAYLTQYIRHVCEKQATQLGSPSENVAAIQTPPILLVIFAWVLQANYAYCSSQSDQLMVASF